jgi:mono/diheme cytochrome c family protein
MRKTMRHLVLLSSLLMLSACRQDMHDQPRYEPMEASDFFGDRSSMRPQVSGTVARGELRLDTHLYEGKLNGELAKSFPFPITAELLRRGQNRYQIFCSACHGSTGSGEGMVVKRGMKQPPSYHIERLREVEHGYLFDVITNGYGAMYDLSDKIKAEDRWAVVAYVRALQLSQNGRLEDVPEELRGALEDDQ